MINLRVLDREEDENLFLESWEWQFTKPKRWQELFAIWTETKDEYLAKRFDLSQTDIGIFCEDEFIGLITLNETYPTVFEVHFDCKRFAETENLIEGIFIAREFVFSKGATCLFVFVAPQNRTIEKVILSVGFLPTNIEVIYGQFRGKVIGWKQYILLPNKNSID